MDYSLVLIMIDTMQRWKESLILYRIQQLMDLIQ